MKSFLFVFVSYFLFTYLNAQDSVVHQRPKIGLTLSGGGAKGLAHIGILKAIDSAGLKIDYVTGTSMGSIIGVLYAAGYSADSIEKIGRKIDWDLLLSNQMSLRSIIMEEKSEYYKYDVELPWVNNWFRISTGVLEGQELWLRLSEFLFPLHKIKNFNDFPIPFRCIATDISTGKAVVLDSGEIVSAIRSSMAIPSLFTAVEYNGKKLVDGGVVRNFPVKDVKDMGADIVVGSNVSSALLAPDKVVNAIQVLMQVAFFREAEDTREEVPLCNIYVGMPLEKYSMLSFGNSDEIIDYGIVEGRKLYPVFKHLADSLNAIYGNTDTIQKKLPDENRIKIVTYEVKGLQHTSKEFFIHQLNLYTNHFYTAADISHMVRRASGTRYYSKVIYSLQSIDDSTCNAIFEVEENPLTFAKIGLNYNQFSGISAILNITSRDFFTPNSRSLVTLNIGQNFRARAEHLQYLGRISNFALNLGAQFDQFNITSYSNYKEEGIYNQGYFRGDARLGYSTSRNILTGVGTRFEWIKYNPSISSSLEFQGRNNFFTSYAFLKHNTLDRVLFPKKGLKIDAEIDWVYTQHPDVETHSTGSFHDTLFASGAYARALFNLENYIPFSTKSVLLLNIQSGLNFNYENNIMNEFSIGGLINQFHNQITFAGLREGSFYSPSVAELQMGFRQQIFSSAYLTAKANVLFNNFISTSSFFSNPDFLSGYSLTFAYNFALGPLEISAMYCDQSKRVLGYVNIGIPF
ncbi:MAG TPA: patatin-like phospholipase family protein [Puia sp.]|nr:patatin-like phospholipase family protein [Puia sp.]